MAGKGGEKGEQNEQGSQAHGKGISIEAAKVPERPGRRKIKAGRDRVGRSIVAPFSDAGGRALR